MAVNKSNELLVRLDERTLTFEKSLNFLMAENRQGIQQVIAALKEHATDDAKNFDAHDKKFDAQDIRVKILENWRWYILGALATIGFLVWYLKA